MCRGFMYGAFSALRGVGQQYFLSLFRLDGKRYPHGDAFLCENVKNPPTADFLSRGVFFCVKHFDKITQKN